MKKHQLRRLTHFSLTKVSLLRNSDVLCLPGRGLDLEHEAEASEPLPTVFDSIYANQLFIIIQVELEDVLTLALREDEQFLIFTVQEFDLIDEVLSLVSEYFLDRILLVEAEDPLVM